MTVALYYSPGACSLAPHIVLNEIGEPFELRQFATADNANFSDEYLEINPKGLIPALEIDGFILTENPAILTFLGRRFPAAELYPATGSEDEARCLELMAWSSNTVHVSFAQLFRPERYVLDEQNYPLVKDSGRVNYHNCLEQINERLTTQDYALGSQFSVIDPFWLVFYRWGRMAGFDMKGDYPAYTAYVERLCTRPSVAKALQTENIAIWE